MGRNIAKILLASVVLMSVAGQAQAGLLSPDQFTPARFLPPPPAAGSPDAVAEVAELKAIAARATPQMLEQARKDDGDEKPDLFQAVLGPSLDLAKLPATDKLLNEVGEEEEDDSKSAKTFFHRDRPWIVDSTIVTCVPHKPGPAATSYPSGHTTVAFSMGVVLADLLPAKSQAILKRASEFAENRMVCGMHFRSDIVAGQQFGTILALQLMQVPAFKADYDAAAAELAAAQR